MKRRKGKRSEAGQARTMQFDGRAMTRQAMSGNPALLAEMERGWAREDAGPKTYEEWRRYFNLDDELGAEA